MWKSILSDSHYLQYKALSLSSIFRVDVCIRLIVLSLCLCDWLARKGSNVLPVFVSQSRWLLMPLRPWTKCSGASQMRPLTLSVKPLEHNWHLFGTRMECRFQQMDHRSPSLKLPPMTVESISVSGQVNSDPPKFLIALAWPWWYVTEVGIHFVHTHTH